jgi:hypothetical protein
VTRRPGRVRAAAALLFLCSLLVGGAPARAAPAAHGRAVLVVVVSGATFEDALADPVLRAVATRGGAALLSARTVDGDAGAGHWLTLGTGTRSVAPFASARIERRGNVVGVAGFRRLVDANAGRSEPGLLGSVLASHGVTACALGRNAALAAMNRRGVVPAASGCGVTFAGFRLPGAGAADPTARRRALARLTSALPALLPNVHTVLLVVLSPAPSPAMDRVRDELTPVVLAEGPPRALVAGNGPEHTLTSDTTRRTGLVSNEDVAPTVLRFLGIPVPHEMDGSPIRVVREAGPPAAMHREHLQNRRIDTPVGLLALAWVVTAGVLPIVLLARRRKVPPRVARWAAVLPLSVLPIGTALLAAGRLGSQTYANAVPFVLVMTLGVTLLGLEFRDRGVLVPAAVIGAVVLAYFAVDAIQRWPDTPFTLLGGTALDGARFYGLPNNMIGILLGAALSVAALMSPKGGFALLVAAGLFAGFPDLGADLGGAVTLFVAAGLWWGFRTRGRFRVKDLAVTAATAVAGLAVVLAAQVVLAGTPTHGTRFVEAAPHRGIGGVAHVFVDRWGTGVRLILHSPLSWIVVVGLPVALVVALRPPAVVREAFDRHPPWRAVVLTALVAGIVAYVVNDTGVAAAGFCFGFGVAAMLSLPMLEGPWGGGPARAPTRSRAEART